VLTARHLGRFNALSLEGVGPRPLPDAPWPGRDWLRPWPARVGRFDRGAGPLLVDGAAWAHPPVSAEPVSGRVGEGGPAGLQRGEVGVRVAPEAAPQRLAVLGGAQGAPLLLPPGRRHGREPPAERGLRDGARGGGVDGEAAHPVAYDGAAPVTWRVGAYVLAERGGRVLMIESLQSGRWGLPGGGVEVHETLPEGAARECFEETGYRVVAAGPDPLHVAEQFFSWRGEVRRYWPARSVVYRATVAPEADPAWAPDPAEVRSVRWVDPAGLTPATTQPHQWPALRRAGLV
jgi:8-oxo-dGTP pyrophosphatase MutT (NUDIX family)